MTALLEVFFVSILNTGKWQNLREEQSQAGVYSVSTVELRNRKANCIAKSKDRYTTNTSEQNCVELCLSCYDQFRLSP